jgi:hypothetical protein
MLRDYYFSHLVYQIRALSFVVFGIVCQSAHCQVENQQQSSFQQFIDMFSVDSIFQLSRIQFPLEIIVDDDTVFLKQEEWGFRPYYFGHEFSTILFSDRINYERAFFTQVNDTLIAISAFFEKDFQFQKLLFQSIGAEWKLVQLILYDVRSSQNECFFHFIRSFFTDYEFRVGRIAAGAEYCYLDDGINTITRGIRVNDLETDHDYLIKVSLR